MKALYRGFQVSKDLRQTSLSNSELIKKDLLNHIFTIKGERVYMPEWGTRIPLMKFEPINEATIKIIKDDLKEVFTYDPRVELVDLAVVALPDQNAIVAFADIKFIELNQTETWKLEFPF